MAKRQVVVMIDDLTGKELAEGKAESVRFSLDGVSYELDTTAKSVAALRKALDPYVSAGRRVRHGGGRPARVEVAPDPRAVRAWASSRGIKLSARGRVPAEIVTQYRAAGN